IVIRREDDFGRDHYIFFNGEHGNAVVRGEGHEQPDQLQLLYYVDETSYLKDTGYDKATGTTNSTWNDFRYNNALSPVIDALKTPRLHISKRRKISDHNFADTYYIKKAKIAILNGGVDIKTTSLISNGNSID